jgi:hypothetical protein
VAEVSAKRWGYAAIAFGALAVLVAVLADPLGIGEDESGFGWKQGFPVSVGVSVALGGVGVIRGLVRRPQTESSWRGDPTNPDERQ